MKKARLLLFPFSLVYGLVMWIRNALYDAGILKSTSFPIPIINIGNLNTGGTGKTPHAEYLVSLLSAHKNVAVLSRGYGRTSKGFFEVNVNDNAEQTGDEPLQIKKKFNSAHVFVCESRVEGVKSILQKYPSTEVILLDDAFQHRSIKAGFNILLTQYNDLFCDDFVLPGGNLREPSSGAKRAEVIIVTKCLPEISAHEKALISKRLTALTTQKVFFTSLQYASLKNLFSHEELSLSDLQGFEILLVTAIAGTTAITSFLNSKSKKIYPLKFGDHHSYCSKDLSQIREKFNILASPNKIIVVTEKDAVKLSDEKLSSFLKDIPVFYLPVKVLFEPNEEKLFKELIYEYVGKN